MKKFLLTFVLLTLAVWAGAQVSVTARVDKTNLTLDDELTLTVEVNGASGNMVMPQLPSLPAFNVYSREVQRTSVNGQTSTVFRYTMLPRFVGNATIGAIQFTYNGKTYKTDPISVSIYRNAQGIAQSRPASSSATTKWAISRSACGTYSRMRQISRSDKNRWVARTERSHTVSSCCSRAGVRAVISTSFMGWLLW